ncbi:MULTISPECIES: ubiquinone biosynthesis hydroxylase [unclassified Roseitalea]|uniref:ubiquinone biosynthesis hydroxylase n=1 Tax=unclassified Roseitalea TaxID=2639107 RepID=UPI00273D9F71|nr:MULTISPECIES: ubiquinone biosynthesis hydroxylase [unclassified Roseitalea]
MRAAAPPSCDVFVAGGGYVGLATALAVAAGAPDLKVVVADAAPQGVWERDGRASAIAAAACRMLEALGCWDDLKPHAQPMTEMIVTDSRAADPVRPVFLTFDGEVEPGEPFAHMLPNVELVRALRRRCAEAGVQIVQGVGVTGLAGAGGTMTVDLADGQVVRSRLLVACDGVRSRLRDMAGIRTVHWDYGQSGIVATIAHERAHGGRAEEHFLPAGPFAILPLTGNRSSIVWTETTRQAERLLAADPLTFEHELEMRFGLKLGAIGVEDGPRAYPLGLTLARDFVKERFALAGDAAHGIHPIAGQGLNLGFKDAAALAETLVDAHRLGQDIGALDVLERYQRWRRFDTLQMGVTTDVLNRLFSNDLAPVRAARDLGLGLVDRMPQLKSFFIKQAAGLSGAAPRLLRGQSV